MKRMGHVAVWVWVLACPSVLFGASPAATTRPALVNPFEQPGNWYKGGLHAHTKASDGDSVLADRVQQYKAKGYAVLAITDHHKTSDVRVVGDKDMLFISGMEMHPRCKTGAPSHHLVALNVPQDFTLPEINDPQAWVDAVRRVGGEVIYAHPYWNGHTVHDILAVKGIMGIEVFNAVCTGIGKGCSAVQWDDLLNRGRIMPAVAVDDAHGVGGVGRGWVMIKAEKLDLPTIMQALRQGCFYSSTGPVIEDCRTMCERKIKIKCSPVARINVMSQYHYGGTQTAEEGKELTEATLNIRREAKYVRVELVDRQGRQAWTNPIELPKD